MGGKLSLDNVSKDFDGFNISEISLTVNPGEYMVVIGPTGAGKTLLLETIQGFHDLDKGIITLNDADVTQIPQRQRRIAYVPQNPYFPPDRRVRQVLEFGVNRLDYPDPTPMVEGITKMMRLEDHLNRQVMTLSGGEKRKLALARALIQQPLLLLLDEPLNNLDVMSKHDLREELSIIHSYLDLTVIHVTHDQTEALTLADRLAVIRDGKLVTEGTVENVYNNPVDEYAARFLGYENIYPVKELEVSRKYSKVNIGDIILRTSNPLSSRGKVAIHGSDIILHRKTPMNTDDNLYQGKVTRISTTGPNAFVTVYIGVPVTLTMGRRAYKASRLQVGEKLWVQFGTDSVKPIRV